MPPIRVSYELWMYPLPLKRRYISIGLYGFTSRNEIIFVIRCRVLNYLSTVLNIIGCGRQLGSWGWTGGGVSHDSAMRCSTVGQLMLCHLDNTTCLTALHYFMHTAVTCCSSGCTSSVFDIVHSPCAACLQLHMIDFCEENTRMRTIKSVRKIYRSLYSLSKRRWACREILREGVVAICFSENLLRCVS